MSSHGSHSDPSFCTVGNVPTVPSLSSDDKPQQNIHSASLSSSSSSSMSKLQALFPSEVLRSSLSCYVGNVFCLTQYVAQVPKFV
jgi:hypothetical protein